MRAFTVFLWMLASWFFSVAGAATDVTENDGKIAYSHSAGGGSPICSDERKRELATRMLQGYAAAMKEHFDPNSLLLDAQAVLGGSFSHVDIQHMVVNVTATRHYDEIVQEEAKKSREGDFLTEIHKVAPTHNKYADRHILAMEETANDFDCMEREFDLSSDSYNETEASLVLEKCRLVVLRNVFDKDMIQSYRDELGDYLGGLHTGRVSRSGKTTHGEGGFFLKRFSKRWEILLPQSLASEEILGHSATLGVLHDDRILSSKMMVHSAGAVIAESGAVAGGWHYDDDYLFGWDSLNSRGIGGHDLPLYAATMMTPMLNVTYSHGPTEFCMGTSHLRGVVMTPNVVDADLLEVGTAYESMRRHRGQKLSCPPSAWRAPMLNIGDAIMFDYQIDHRGGANDSPDMRTMLYTTYSRMWYRDSNFGASMFQGKSSSGARFSTLTSSTRFAIPDKMGKCQGEECVPMERIENFLGRSTNQEGIVDSDGEELLVAFSVSNRDLDVDALAIYLDELYATALPIGRSRHLSGIVVGRKVSIRDRDSGFVYKEWIVRPRMGQIVLSNLMFPELNL